MFYSQNLWKSHIISKIDFKLTKSAIWSSIIEFFLNAILNLCSSKKKNQIIFSMNFKQDYFGISEVSFSNLATRKEHCKSS